MAASGCAAQKRQYSACLLPDGAMAPSRRAQAATTWTDLLSLVRSRPAADADLKKKETGSTAKGLFDYFARQLKLVLDYCDEKKSSKGFYSYQKKSSELLSFPRSSWGLGICSWLFGDLVLAIPIELVGIYWIGSLGE